MIPLHWEVRTLRGFITRQFTLEGMAKPVWKPGLGDSFRLAHELAKLSSHITIVAGYKKIWKKGETWFSSRVRSSLRYHICRAEIILGQRRKDNRLSKSWLGAPMRSFTKILGPLRKWKMSWKGGQNFELSLTNIDWVVFSWKLAYGSWSEIEGDPKAVIWRRMERFLEKLFDEDSGDTTDRRDGPDLLWCCPEIATRLRQRRSRLLGCCNLHLRRYLAWRYGFHGNKLLSRLKQSFCVK